MSPKMSLANCVAAAMCRCANYPLRSLISRKGTRTRISISCPFDWSDQTRISSTFAYLSRMRAAAFDPCMPTPGTKVANRPEWLHEIKHDGYRLIVQREGKRIRLFTRNGYDWSHRFPLIVRAALRNRQSSFVIDGEAVLLGVDGRSDFDSLHSRKHDDEVQFYAFDMLALEGEDLRPLPLHLRKAKLARLLARRVNGIFLSDFEQGEIGPDLFRQA